MISMQPLRLFPTLFLLSILPFAAVHAQNADFPFRDPALTVNQRIDDLISRMTLEEKKPPLWQPWPVST